MNTLMSSYKFFVVLPSITPPNYFLYRQNRRIFKTGLNFYNAMSLSAKLKKKLIVSLYPLFSKTNIFSIPSHVPNENLTRLSDFLSLLNESTSFKYNIYMPAYNRAIMQIVSFNGICKKIIKVSLTESSKDNLMTEYRNLQHLNKYQLSAFNSPTPMRCESKGGYYFIEYTCPAVYKPFDKYQLNGDIVAVLAELMNKSKSMHVSMGDSRLFNDIINRIKDLNNMEITTIWEELKTSDVFDYNKCMVPTGIVHNDFKPWNMLINTNDNKIWLVDWELMDSSGFPFWDIYCYLFFTYATIRYNVSPLEFVKLYKKYVPLLVKYAQLLNIDESLCQKLLPLYLIDLISKPGLWDKWEANEMRPRMIRQSLLNFLIYTIKNSNWYQ